MATVIDALLVTLGIDPSGFKKGHKEAQDALKKTGEEAKKQNAEMDAGIKQLANGYRAVRNELLAMVGVTLSMSGMRQFIEAITKSDAATGRLAGNLGIATQELSAYQNMAKRFGGSAEDMASSFRTVNDIIQNLRLNGWDERLLPLQRAGLDTARFASASIDNAQRMKMLADLFSRISAQDAQFFGRQAGFSEDTINVLREAGTKLDDIVAKQRALNAASEEDKRLAIERQKAWADLGDAIEAAGRKMLNVVSPGAVAALKFGEQQSKKGILGQLWDVLSGRATLGATGAAWNAYGSGSSTPAERISGGKVGTAPNMNAAGLLSSLERQYGLPAGLLDAVWTQESARGKHMLSPAGAKGHFGFMPRTATEYGIAGQENDLGASADAAARKFRDLLKRYGGNLNTALAAYNAGDKRVLSGGPLPAETIRYIQQISERMGRRDAAAGVQIDQVNVYSRAADGDGLARDFVHSTHRELSLAAQAESGVN